MSRFAQYYGKMAKKSKKKEDETNEVIANCDNLRSLKFYHLR